MTSEDRIPFEEDESSSRITAILDSGFELLQAHSNYLLNDIHLLKHVITQDYDNIDFLIDYLANHHSKSVLEINEYELRWFIFSYYIRKSTLGSDTEERLFSSLDRFFTFLTRNYGFQPADWLQGVLDEENYYQARRGAYRSLNEEDERLWKEGFQHWCEELNSDLDARSLLVPNELGDGITWSDAMGWREATLRNEAVNLWQSEREQLLGAGAIAETIREQLVIVYLEWVDTPQDRLDGQSPAEVILAERLESDQEVEDDEAEDDSEPSY